MKISEKIKQLRASHNMTQLEFAKIAGVSDKAVSTWEKGIKEPRMSSLTRICTHFNLDLNVFADESDGEKLRPSSPSKRPKYMSNRIVELQDGMLADLKQKYSPPNKTARILQQYLFSVAQIRLEQTEDDKAISKVTLYPYINWKVPEEIFSCDENNLESIENRLVNIFDVCPDENLKLHFLYGLLKEEGAKKTLIYIKDMIGNPKYRRSIKDFVSELNT